MSLQSKQQVEDRPPSDSSAKGYTTLEGVSIVLLFGCTGSGKTSFANIASGSSLHVGDGMKSSTKTVEPSEVFLVDNTRVAIVDCPGFDDTHLSETEVLRRLGAFMTTSYINEYKLVGLFYMHKITDTRVGGASLRHMNMFKSLCGPGSLENAVYVTNMWSQPPTEAEIQRESELEEGKEFFGGPLDGGAQMARHTNTRESAHDIIRRILKKSPTVTRLQEQLLQEGASLVDTDIGRAIGEDLDDALCQQQQEMEGLLAEKQRALETSNEDWVQRLEILERAAKEREQQLADQIGHLKEGGHLKSAFSHEDRPKHRSKTPIQAMVSDTSGKRRLNGPELPGATRHTSKATSHRGQVEMPQEGLMNPEPYTCSALGPSQLDNPQDFLARIREDNQKHSARMDRRAENATADYRTRGEQPSIAHRAGESLVRIGRGIAAAGNGVADVVKGTGQLAKLILQ